MALKKKKKKKPYNNFLYLDYVVYGCPQLLMTIFPPYTHLRFEGYTERIVNWIVVSVLPYWLYSSIPKVDYSLMASFMGQNLAAQPTAGGHQNPYRAR